MFFELNLYSEELKMNTPVNVILPDRVEEGQTYKTLWLLHRKGRGKSAYPTSASYDLPRNGKNDGESQALPGGREIAHY